MKKRVLLSVLLPVQFLLIKILSFFPETIEHIYSRNIYPFIAYMAQFLLGWIPFSAGDFLYIFLVVLLVRLLYALWKHRKKGFKKHLFRLLAAISVIYGCFHLFWGLNYYRRPIHENLQIQTGYSEEELYQFTRKLVQKSNKAQLLLTKDRHLPVVYTYNKKELNKLAIQGYNRIPDRVISLKFHFKQVKHSLFSVPLTYMGFSGYLNPLTNEAQINSKVPLYIQPVTITHEMGHQLGYAKENEANFMAALATINHPDPYFNYAGLTFALRYCLSDLFKSNPESARALLEEINPGIRENFKEINDFWSQYENPLEPFFKRFYSGYLKVNNQPEGMKSYNYVVALLVNYYRGANAL